MRECITVQVGQCGNQVGTSFWDLLVREHAARAEDGLFDESMSMFFRNVDIRPTGHCDIVGNSPIRFLKARAVLIDSEEGVLSSVMSGSLRELFDEQELIKGVSGAGNNFAHGHFGYGPQYKDTVLESVRRAAEVCDSLQGFFLFHSLGGGTGSGMGTYVLSLLEDAYPDVYRFAVSVFPSGEDDVVTSPYNSAFAACELREHADCVFPIENQALLEMSKSLHPIKRISSPPNVSANSPKPFDEMNSLAAQMVANLTSCSRFPGELNVDLSEISTNLVPFPKTNFICSSLSPLLPGPQVGSCAKAKSLDRAFKGMLDANYVHSKRKLMLGIFARENQFCVTDPIQSKYLACALLVRGNVPLSDVNRNIEQSMRRMDFVHWNQEGFKIGLCSTPPLTVSRTSIPFEARHDLFLHSTLSQPYASRIIAAFAQLLPVWRTDSIVYMESAKLSFIIIHSTSRSRPLQVRDVYESIALFIHGNELDALYTLQEIQAEYAELQLSGTVKEHQNDLDREGLLTEVS